MLSPVGIYRVPWERYDIQLLHFNTSILLEYVHYNGRKMEVKNNCEYMNKKKWSHQRNGNFEGHMETN